MSLRTSSSKVHLEFGGLKWDLLLPFFVVVVIVVIDSYLRAIKRVRERENIGLLSHKLYILYIYIYKLYIYIYNLFYPIFSIGRRNDVITTTITTTRR